MQIARSRIARGDGGATTSRRIAAVCVVVALAGCRGGRGDSGAGALSPIVAVAVASDRFPHALHTGNDPRIRGYKGRGLACTDCHPRDAVLAGERARPGRADHAPCDECHKSEFYQPPGIFCKNCHTEVVPTLRGATKLQPYPERGYQHALASDFSHRVHLDRPAMERAVGFHVGCADCHARDRDSLDPSLPGHAECARCHAQNAAAKKVAAMDNCASCHPARDVGLKRGRLFIVGDLIFSHAAHVADTSGAAIACELCHDDIERSRSVTDASVPPMQRCAECHEDAARTPERVRLARCEVCHSAITAGSAPRSHHVGKQVPESHTLEFRHNHGEAALEPDARCEFCHDGLSGSPRDRCYECHVVMRPRSHDLGWRDDAHGREASAERDGCQTCHQSDWCTACHAIPPRSHQPLGQFRLGGHAQPARFELSSCFACHTFQDTCSSCHRSVR
jgi:hypothetical protein